MNPTTAYLLVALGSMIGGTSRYALASIIDTRYVHHMPWGTIVVNITGCFLMGLLGTLTESDKLRLFLLTGIMGGYTTFSAFSFQTLKLYENGRPEGAAANVAISVACCLISVWLGATLARALTPGRT